MNYEPRHYRYVGVEAAEEIFNNQICLEEYLKWEFVAFGEIPS